MLATIMDTINSCFFYQNILNTTDWKLKEEQHELDTIDKKFLISILNSYPDAYFEENVITYNRPLTKDEIESELKEASVRLELYTSNLNILLTRYPEDKPSVARYLMNHDREIENLIYLSLS